MSYILDALKKAERERHVTKVPTLDTVHRTPAGRRYPQWMWIGAAVVLVNAGLLLWFLRPASMTDRSPSPAPMSVASGPAAKPSAPAARPAAPPPAAPAAAAHPPAPVAPPAPVFRPAETTARGSDAKPSPFPALVPVAPRTEPSRAPAPEVPRQMKTTAPERPVPAAQAPALPSSTAPAPVPGPLAAPTMGAPRAPVAPGPGEAPAAVASVPSPVERAPAAPGAVPAPGSPPGPGIQELTPTEQEGMPKLSLQFLVYSEVPSERLVFINNQKYVEGQSVEGKVVVEGILPDGAILSYQGKRFKLRQ